MIRFPCGTCGRRLRVPARLAGKRGRCERCGAINRVPPADVPLAEDERARETPPEPVHPEVGAESSATAVAPPPPPAPRAEAARSFSTDAVPVEQSAAVEVAPPAFGIDEASVFPPVGEFDRVEEVDFSSPPAGATDEAASANTTEPQAESGADEPSPGGADAEIEAEPEPEVVPVDVRRAPASPFRTTADMRPREMIEGSVEVPGAQFAAATLPATIGPAAGAGSGGSASTFLELVAQRMGVIDKPAPGTTTQAIAQKLVHGGAAVEPDDDEPVIRILHIDVDDVPRAPARGAREARGRVPEHRRTAPVARAALPPAAADSVSLSARRGIVMALLVGLIIGFVLGLLVADLI